MQRPERERSRAWEMRRPSAGQEALVSRGLLISFNSLCLLSKTGWGVVVLMAVLTVYLCKELEVAGEGLCGGCLGCNASILSCRGLGSLASPSLWVRLFEARVPAPL